MIVTNYTTDDMKKLPLRAIVAFSARCAAGVERLAQPPDGHPETKRWGAAIADVLPVAEDFARGLPCPTADSTVGAIEACPEFAQGDLPRENASRPSSGRLTRPPRALHRWPSAKSRWAGGLSAVDRRWIPCRRTWRVSRPTWPRGCLHDGRQRRRCRGLCRRLHGRGRRGLQEAPRHSSSGGIPRPGCRSTLLRKGRSGRCGRGRPPGPESRHEGALSTAPHWGHIVRLWNRYGPLFQSPRRGSHRSAQGNALGSRSDVKTRP